MYQHVKQLKTKLSNEFTPCKGTLPPESWSQHGVSTCADWTVLLLRGEESSYLRRPWSMGLALRSCQPLDPEEVLAEVRQLCHSGFMVQVCMRRGGVSLGGPAQDHETLEQEWNWLHRLLALSAPAQARPGQPGAGGPGPGLLYRSPVPPLDSCSDPFPSHPLRHRRETKHPVMTGLLRLITAFSGRQCRGNLPIFSSSCPVCLA